MGKRRRLETFWVSIFRWQPEKQQRRQDIGSAVAFVARVGTTAGAFAYCGWIAAGDVGAGIMAIMVFALWTGSANGRRSTGSVTDHGQQVP